MRSFATLAALLSSAVLLASMPSVKGNTGMLHALSVPSREAKAQHKRGLIWHRMDKITWYGKKQLKAPACGGPDPDPMSLIAAALDPKNGGVFKCGEVVWIKGPHGGVNVTIVDFCQACSVLHLDLSRGAYSLLTGKGVDGDVGQVQFLNLGKSSKKNNDSNSNKKKGSDSEKNKNKKKSGSNKDHHKDNGKGSHH